MQSRASPRSCTVRRWRMSLMCVRQSPIRHHVRQAPQRNCWVQCHVCFIARSSSTNTVLYVRSATKRDARKRTETTTSQEEKSHTRLCSAHHRESFPSVASPALSPFTGRSTSDLSTHSPPEKVMESALKALTKAKKPSESEQSPALPTLRTSPRPPGMSEEKFAYWTKLSTPRAGYSRDPATGPAKWTNEAVWQRNAFLAEHGYLSAGPEERRQRRYGSAHRSKKAPTVHEPTELSIQQQRARLYFCFRATRPIPERYLQAARPPTPQQWVKPLP